LPEKTSTAKAGVKKLSEELKKGIGNIVQFFGGWTTIGITAAITAISVLYAKWRQAGAAIRETTKAMEDAKVENIKLGSTFKSIV
jgi:hypothetical protein